MSFAYPSPRRETFREYGGSFGALPPIDDSRHGPPQSLHIWFFLQR